MARAVQVETVLADVDTEKRHRVHERSSAENEKSPASVNLQGFSVRLTISLSPEPVGAFHFSVLHQASMVQPIIRKC